MIESSPRRPEEKKGRKGAREKGTVSQVSPAPFLPCSLALRPLRLWLALLTVTALAVLQPGCSGTRLFGPSDDTPHAQRTRRDAEVARRFSQRRDAAEFEEALSRWNEQDLRGCREALDRLLSRNPAHREARLLLADLLVAVHQPREALAEVQKALTAYPHDADVQYALALMLDANGRSGEALAYYEQAAKTAPDNGGVFLVPAFAGLGAPHWDQFARGTIAGLTRGTTAGHLARAALESIAYQTADVLSAMEADSGIAIAELRVDGGATANDTLMQFQADILGVPLVRPKVWETTALGAAYLAGLATGFWKNIHELQSQWQRERTFQPAMDRERAAALRRGWRKAVERSKGWLKD